MGHRISSLPIVQYCGEAGNLSDSGSSGRRAVMGTAFHSYAYTGIFEPEKFGLTEAEADEISEWYVPKEFDVDGELIKYKDMVRETEVSLSLPNGDVSIGHPDAYILTNEYLLVVDIKSTRWTTSDGLDSLQLHGYAMAILESTEDFSSDIPYRVALYSADTGDFQYSHLITGDEKRSWANKVYYAAANNKLVTGPHCMGCWNRLRCRAHMVEAIESIPGLESMSDMESMTAEEASKALLAIKALEKVIDKAQDNLKAFSKKHGGIPLEPGYHWAPVESMGRLRLTVADVKSKYPDVYNECSKRGSPSVSFRRVKKK